MKARHLMDWGFPPSCCPTQQDASTSTLRRRYRPGQEPLESSQPLQLFMKKLNLDLVGVSSSTLRETHGRYRDATVVRTTMFPDLEV